MPVDADTLVKLRMELETLFESARVNAQSWLDQAGLPLTTTTNRTIVEPNEEGNGWGSRQVRIEQNILAAERDFFQLWRLEAGLVTNEWLARAYELAGRLLPLFAATMPSPAPFAPTGGDLIGRDLADVDPSDPALKLMWQFVVAPARWYLRRLPSVDVRALEIAQGIANEVLFILANGEFLVRQLVPLDGLKMRDKLEYGSCRVRALSPIERGEFVEWTHGVASSVLAPLALAGKWVVPEFLLEVDTVYRDPATFHMIPTPPLVMALELHGVPVAGPGTVTRQVIPEWFGFGRSTSPIPMQGSLGVKALEMTAEGFATACRTAELLATFSLEDPQQTAELALRRFRLGCGRDDPRDAVIDFVIALEGLLLPYDDSTRRTEMGYRFRMHGAHFIASNPLERPALHCQLRDLYDIRSRLVHGGGRHPTHADLVEAARKARGLAARGLLKAVSEGFPNAEYFRRALLGVARQP